jgi:Neisseria meningitidis TspB protein
MDLHSKLVALLLGISAGTAHAGYAQMSPPSGWSAPAAAGERAMFRAAANEAWVGNTVRTSGALNVGGRAVTMPVAMRLAANAPSFAARAMFGMNPLLMGAGMAAWLLLSNIQWDSDQQKWTKAGPGWTPSDGLEYRITISGQTTAWVGDPESACHQVLALLQNVDGYARSGALVSGQCVVTYQSGPNMGSSIALPVNWRPAGNCPIGWWWIGGTCSPNPQRVPMTQPEFEEALPGKPMPSTVPQELPPGTPMPVEQPVINPSPGSNPQSQPMRVPQGNPQPVPDSNPQQWRQPMTRVTPAPSPSSPWQVDLTPEDVVSNNPDGIKDPTTVEETDPSGQPRQPDLCEKNPDILACQKLSLGNLQPVAVPNQNKTLAITKDEGWGPASAACPAPRTAQVLGMTLSMPFTMLCQFAEAIRPLFIAFAWLSAALTFFGIGRRE